MTKRFYPEEETASSETSDDSLFEGRVKIKQPIDGYRVGTDGVMLAAAIDGGKGTSRMLDMGAGVGAVSLAVIERLGAGHITAVEKDPISYNLLKQNITINQADEYIRPLLADITSLPVMLKASFDHVFANPPFHHKHDVPPRSRRRRLAHHGDEATSLVDWIASGLWALKPKGRISLIVRADRSDQIITALRDGGAGEILLFPLWSSPGSLAIRMIITARSKVKGGMALLPGLILHNSSGALTPDAQKVMKGEGLLLSHPATRHLDGRQQKDNK